MPGKYLSRGSKSPREDRKSTMMLAHPGKLEELRLQEFLDKDKQLFKIKLDKMIQKIEHSNLPNKIEPSNNGQKEKSRVEHSNSLQRKFKRSHMLTQIMRHDMKSFTDRTPETSFIHPHRNPPQSVENLGKKNFGNTLIANSGAEKGVPREGEAVLSPFTIGFGNLRPNEPSPRDSSMTKKEKLAQIVHPRYRSESDRKEAVHQLMEKCKLPKDLVKAKGSEESSFTTVVGTTDVGETKIQETANNRSMFAQQTASAGKSVASVQILPHVKSSGVWVGALNGASSSKKLQSGLTSTKWNRSILGTTWTPGEYTTKSSGVLAGGPFPSTPSSKAYYFREGLATGRQPKRSGQPTTNSDRSRFDEVRSTLQEAQRLLLSHSSRENHPN